MDKFCKYCGRPLKPGASFCDGCGKPLRKPDAAPEKKAQPAPQTAPAPQAEKAGKEKGGFFAVLKAAVVDLVKHPTKLIPTIVLAVVWTVLPLVMGFVTAANIPVVRFLSTITYANGGMFGGFFGALGGIFGKAVFAAVLTSVILSLCAKKNPFTGLKNGFSGILTGGITECLPFAIAGGVGIVLYFFFNVTSAPQNIAISVICAVAGLQAVASQNGLLFAAVFFLLKKISQGKAPTKRSVNHALTGFTAGFIISFPLTFLRYPWIILTVGLVLLIGGIACAVILHILSKKQAAAAAGKDAAA